MDEDTEDMRGQLRKMVDGADHANLVDIISRLHLGTLLLGLLNTVEQVVQSGSMPVSENEDEEYMAMASTFVTHKILGKTYQVTVGEATEEEALRAQQEAAASLTKH